jgi:hypothetical protein
MLLRTIDERSRLIGRLRGWIAAQHARLEAQGNPSPAVSDVTSLTGPADPRSMFEGKRRKTSLLRGFFTPLSEEQTRHFHELNEDIGKLRVFCAKQVEVIDELHARLQVLKAS